MLTFRNRILFLQLATVVLTALLIGILSNLLLQSSLEGLQGSFSQAEQQDFLQEIPSRAETLARLIDELLSIGRIESEHPLALEFIAAGRIQQALENVLGNAVKYSAEETVIRISGKIIGRSFQILIKDEGVGMLPEQVAQIFNKFYRVDFSNTKTSGLGIGMSIVKQIIDGHGGRIEVRSKLGSGTSVVFNLPLAD